jgi:hypothetical protein
MHDELRDLAELVEALPSNSAVKATLQEEIAKCLTYEQRYVTDFLLTINSAEHQV